MNITETKISHTPGPWKIDGENDNPEIFKGGIQICKVSGQYANPPRSEANARLIAAAPELLAMAREYRQVLFGMIENPSYRPSSELVEELYKLAVDAIAKAEGGHS